MINQCVAVFSSKINCVLPISFAAVWCKHRGCHLVDIFQMIFVHSFHVTYEGCKIG